MDNVIDQNIFVEKLFGNLIKVSFLEECLKDVQNDNYFRNKPNDDFRSNTFEIMKMITAIHRFNTNGLTENKKGQKQENSDYKKKIM